MKTKSEKMNLSITYYFFLKKKNKRRYIRIINKYNT